MVSYQILVSYQRTNLKGGPVMVFLIANRIGCLAQRFGDIIPTRRPSITNYLAATNLIIRN
jgi:hypothetical protein